MTESLQIRQRDNLRPMLIELKNFRVCEPSMTAPPPYPTPVTTEVNEPGSKLRSRLWWLTIWIICVYPFSVNLVDPDLWGHVQYARDWLADGQLPRHATHTFTAHGHPWINHENLSELALACGFDWLGVSGMLCVKFLLGVALMAFMWRAAQRSDVSTGTFFSVALLSAYALHVFWLFRPQLATWFGLGLMVVSLDRAFVTWKTDGRVRWTWLCCLPPLFLVWANAHGGFLGGLCLLIAYLVGRSVEAIIVRDESYRKHVLLFGLVALATTATTLLNPYGIGLHGWLIKSLGQPRPEILEWHRPSLWAPVFAPFFMLLILTAISWTFSTRKRDWTHALLLSLAGGQALLHIRHIGLFAVLAGFWIPPHVQSLMRRCVGKRLEKLSGDLRRVPWIFGLPVFVVLLMVTCRQLTTLPVPRDRYPVDAVQFMVDHNLHGRLVVSFNWAQYAIAALQPETTVGFDGRFRTCYPQHVIDNHFDFLLGNVPSIRNRAATSGPIDPTALLREGNPDLVLVDRKFPHSVGVMETQSHAFTLLYQDEAAQLWGKKNVAAGHMIAGAKTAKQNDPEWPALPLKTED